MEHEAAGIVVVERRIERELLRWRDLIAALYQSPVPDRALHRAAFRCLLQFHPTAARQIPFLLVGPA